MEHSSDNFTLAGNTMDFVTMDQFLDLSNLSIPFAGESDVDDRLVSLVDSPQGSPLSDVPTSPNSLPDIDSTTIPVENVLSIPDSVPLHFDFGFVEDDTTMYNLEKEILGTKPDIDTDKLTESSSLEAWLSDPKSTHFVNNLSSEEANALLMEAASAAEIFPPDLASSTADSVQNDAERIPCNTSGIIDDDELIGLSVRDLNRRLAMYPKEVQQDLKRRRRTLKNRGYAQSCRTRRMKDKEELANDNNTLTHQLQIAKRKLMEMSNVRRENDSLQAEVRLLRNEVTQLRSLKSRPHSCSTSSSAGSPPSPW